MSVDSKNGANELPRADDKAFADAAASGGRTSSAQPEIAAQDGAKAPAVAAQAHSTEALAREAASPAKGVTVVGGHSPAVQGERQLAGARVISGEVMPPRRPRKRMVLGVVALAAVGIGGYFGFGWWTHGRFIMSTDDAYVAADMSLLAAKVSGLVTSVEVTDNQHVAQGAVLVRIDDGDYKLAVDAAANHLATQDATILRIGKQIDAQNSAIDQAKAQLVSAQAEMVRAQAAFERAQKLAATDFGTKATLDQARADRDKANAGISAAQSAIDSADATIGVLRAQKVEAERSRAELATALDRAKRDLSFTEIHAPFDGVVGNRAVRMGDYVQPGQRLASLVPLDGVYVDANFKETQLARVRPGETATITVDALPDRKISGSVVSIAPASGSMFSLLPPDNATGNFTKIVQRLPVRLEVPADVAREGVLRPGMSVVVRIDTKSGTEPNRAVAAR